MLSSYNMDSENDDEDIKVHIQHSISLKRTLNYKNESVMTSQQSFENQNNSVCYLISKHKNTCRVVLNNIFIFFRFQ